MHSSRMRTGQSLTVFQSLLLPGRGVPAWSGGGCTCLVAGGMCLVLVGVHGLEGCICLVPGAGGYLPGLGGKGVYLPGRGVYLPGLGGVPAWSGGCTWSRGVPAWSRQGVPGLGDVPAWSGGVYLPVHRGYLVRNS